MYHPYFLEKYAWAYHAGEHATPAVEELIRERATPSSPPAGPAQRRADVETPPRHGCCA